MGVEHGGYCVGCGWGIMLALFAVGVMSLFSMAVVAGVIFVQKLAPVRQDRLTRVAAITPRFETMNGTQKLRTILTPVSSVAFPFRITSSWLMIVSTQPTTSAIRIVRPRFAGCLHGAIVSHSAIA